MVLPHGIVSSGFPSAEQTCNRVGIGFDPWQRDLNRAILAKDADGLYAADTVLMSICRQAGKTYDVGALVFADSIKVPDTTTVWTAHRFPVSRESFMALRALASTREMLPFVDPNEITSAAGNECIPFRNGSRILFKARERGAIRGFTKVRRIILDEGQILTESAMSDMAPTQNHAENPQLIIMGTPPKPTDPSEVFLGLRQEALDGTSEGLLYVEFSADPDSDLDDRAAWAKANPSYPNRTSDRAILRLRKLLSDDDFRREALGIFDDVNPISQAINLQQWRALGDVDTSRRPEPVALGVEVSRDRQWSRIALAGVRPDGHHHVQLVRSDKGTGWVATAVAELAAKWSPVATVVDPGSAAGSLVPALSEAGVEPMLLASRDVAAACGSFADAVAEGTVHHPEDRVLEVAVAAAGQRFTAGAWIFDAADRSTDISPLRAVTFARWGLVKSAAQPKRTGVVVGIR